MTLNYSSALVFPSCVRPTASQSVSRPSPARSVYVPLPQIAADALRKITNGEYFFWTGRGLRKSAVADWQRSLRRVFTDAKVTGNAHMFRHYAASRTMPSNVGHESHAGHKLLLKTT